MSKKQANPQQFEQMIAELETIVNNTQAAGILLDRILPRLRPTSPAIAFPLPEADLASQAEAVMREAAVLRVTGGGDRRGIWRDPRPAG